MCLPFLYRFTFYCITPFLFIRLWLRGRKNPAYRTHYKERLGFAPELSNCIWLHAVSLGESIAATPLIKLLLKEYPNTPLLITNTTPTGRAHIERCFGDQVTQAYFPYDTRRFVDRFLNRTSPRIAIIMETELWPTLLDRLNTHSIPSIIANARLSSRSMKRYAHLASWMQSTLQKINLILAQSDRDADHFKQLGAKKEHVIMTGNIKYDARLSQETIDLAATWRSHWGKRFTWIAASTHDGEEALLLKAHAQLCDNNSNTLLLIAPRHPERFDLVASLIEEAGFSYCRRSRNEWPTEEHSVFLLDSLGELTTWYGCADVAFVAGSFAPIGGHNLVEPSLHQKPVITGPNLSNFVAMSQFMLAKKALTIVDDTDSLVKAVSHYESHPDDATRDGQAAYAACQEHQGACDRLLNHIKALLSKEK